MRLSILRLFQGEYSEIDFTYGADTDLHQGCAVEYKNQFYVFGGENEKWQISKIDDCQLQRIGELDINYGFHHGSCGVFNGTSISQGGDDVILLCFPHSNKGKCWR